MAIKSGFWNSVDHDRLYNAEDFNQFFEGVLYPGVFRKVGDALEVSISSGTIYVASGRAWFEDTYIKNEGLFTINTEPLTNFHRKDAIVIQIDKGSRENTIKLITGPLSSYDPTNDNVPVLEEGQYPLAYIVDNTTVIDNRGTETCPWATGISDESNLRLEQIIEKIQSDVVVLQEEQDFSGLELDLKTLTEIVENQGNVINELKTILDGLTVEDGTDLQTQLNALTKSHANMNAAMLSLKNSLGTSVSNNDKYIGYIANNMVYDASRLIANIPVKDIKDGTTRASIELFRYTGGDKWEPMKHIRHTYMVVMPWPEILLQNDEDMLDFQLTSSIIGIISYDGGYISGTYNVQPSTSTAKWRQIAKMGGNGVRSISGDLPAYLLIPPFQVSISGNVATFTLNGYTWPDMNNANLYVYML